jgi:hypothetical protein
LEVRERSDISVSNVHGLRYNITTLTKVATSSFLPDFGECHAQALPTRHVADALPFPTESLLGRPEGQLNGVVLRVIGLQPLDACTSRTDEVDHLELAVEAWTIVQNHNTPGAWVGVQVLQDLSLEASQELRGIIATFHNV